MTLTYYWGNSHGGSLVALLVPPTEEDIDKWLEFIGKPGAMNATPYGAGGEQ